MPTPFKLITASTPVDYENFKTLLQIYYAESDPETQKVTSILKDSADLPGRYAPPTGGIVLAYQGAELAGCGALSATAHSGLAEIWSWLGKRAIAQSVSALCHTTPPLSRSISNSISNPFPTSGKLPQRI